MRAGGWVQPGSEHQFKGNTGSLRLQLHGSQENYLRGSWPQLAGSLSPFALSESCWLVAELVQRAITVEQFFEEGFVGELRGVEFGLQFIEERRGDAPSHPLARAVG